MLLQLVRTDPYDLRVFDLLADLERRAPTTLRLLDLAEIDVGETEVAKRIALAEPFLEQVGEETVVALEDPGYPDMRNIVALKTAHVRAIPVDDAGLVGEELGGERGVAGDEAPRPDGVAPGRSSRP